jgi:hypothetical protein
MTHTQEEALKLSFDLAIMHHTDDGYPELRQKVRRAVKQALAAPAQPKMRRAGIVVPMLGTMRSVVWDDGMIPSAGSILWTKDE